MLRRITKTTSLLACIASVMSIMPVQAADYQKVDTQEGTVYSASAKGKGIFLDAEINGEDEAVYYISEDGKYNKLDEIETGDTLRDLIANKYLEISDGSSDYIYLDITDGYKTVDDCVRENLEDEGARTLKKAIRSANDGRFAESTYSGSNKVESFKEGSNKFLAAGSGLSKYRYTLEDTRLNGDTYSTIYSDLKGNYLDADYNLGTLKVALGTGHATIKNTEDTYDITDNGTEYELKAVIKDGKYLTDTSDSIYRLATLTIYKKKKSEDDSAYKAATSELTFGSKDYSVTTEDSVQVIQKFSKEAASNTIDGIKYPKDSGVYFLADEDGKDENVIGVPGAAVKEFPDAAANGTAKITANTQSITSLYADTTNNKLYMETISLKTKNGFNYVDIGDSDDSDMDAYCTSGGRPWFLNDGYVQTWDGSNIQKLYRVDAGMDSITATGKDNLIVWNEDKEVYAVIHNVAAKADATKTDAAKADTAKTDAVKTDTTTTTTGAAVTTTATTATTTKVTTGWVLNADKTWSYLQNGTKKTGWLNDNGTWYYLKADGIMATGWVNDNGTWYYCNTSGAMLSSTTVDGYVLGANGAWLQ